MIMVLFYTWSFNTLIHRTDFISHVQDFSFLPFNSVNVKNSTNLTFPNILPI